MWHGLLSELLSVMHPCPDLALGGSCSHVVGLGLSLRPWWPQYGPSRLGPGGLFGVGLGRDWPSPVMVVVTWVHAVWYCSSLAPPAVRKLAFIDSRSSLRFVAAAHQLSGHGLERWPWTGWRWGRFWPPSDRAGKGPRPRQGSGSGPWEGEGTAEGRGEGELSLWREGGAQAGSRAWAVQGSGQGQGQGW